MPTLPIWRGPAGPVGDAGPQGEITPEDRQQIDGAVETAAIARVAAGPSDAEYENLAAAVSANPDQVLRVSRAGDPIPAEFADVVLEYTARVPAQNINQSAISADQGLKTLRAQHPEGHPDVKYTTLNIETKARGSGKNGPFSADYGLTLNVAKLGYSSGSAVGGEMDGITMYLRQDGPDGFPSQDPGSSDSAAIMINAQNIGTCGFVALSDCISSNLRRDTGFPIDMSMQCQHGVIDANNAQGKVAFGWVASMKVGVGRSAFHAGAAVGSGWENLLDSPSFRVRWDGEVRFRSTADYADYGASIRRAAGQNSQLQIESRGNLGIALTARDAGSITFATTNIQRWQVNAGGALLPVTDVAVSLGDATRRILTGHFDGVRLYGADLGFWDDTYPTAFAGQMVRGDGLNGSLAVANKGTGGIAITTLEAGAITFATNNANRWVINASGALLPAADNASNLGDITRRLFNAHVNHLRVYSGGTSFWDDAYTGEHASQILRAAGLAGALSISNKGTGGIVIDATEIAPIRFRTQGINRWEINSTGTMVPMVDLAVGLGDASRRIIIGHFNALTVYGNNFATPGLPVHPDNAAAVSGGLASGRQYRTATGEMRVVI